MTASYRGKLLILGMFALAAAAAVFGIWYLRTLSQRSLAYWGPEVADLITRAGKVEAAEMPDGAWRDVSQARGLINLRRALVSDASFDWDAPTTEPVRWQYALRFRDQDRQVLLLISLEAGQVMLEGRPPPVSSRPILSGLKSFLQEHFPAPAS
jgi:hypothetical protein